MKIDEKLKTFIKEKYPFDICSEDGESWIMDMPDGWVDRIIKMYDEIVATLGEENLHRFSILQMKEKFGALRCYYVVTDEDDILSVEITHKIDDIIDSAEKETSRICCVCGEPATRKSRNWILPWCDKCAAKAYKNLKGKTPNFSEESTQEFEKLYTKISKYH